MAEYIDRKAAIDEIDKVLDRYYAADDDKAAEAGDDCRYAIEKTPAADVAPVVRCGSCKHFGHLIGDGKRSCKIYQLPYCADDDFCSKGELADCMIWLKNKFGDLIPVHGWKAVGTTPEGDTIGQNDDGETFVFVDCKVVERRGTDERSE